MNTISTLAINILDLIPQRAPIVMVDALISTDEKITISTFNITASCIFCHNGFLSESGLIEIIAQTGAAGFGYASKKANKPVSLGFIASVKNVTIHQLPPVGTTIKTKVVQMEPVMGFNIIKGEIIRDDVVIANCEMRIFVQT